MFFSNTHWPQLMAPCYSILFETSICQFNISKCSPVMPDEVREHLTRDQRPFLHPESLQIFRFTASSLQFTHSSSTEFRSENTWHEIRDHSFIQNHSRPFRFTASSLQFTHSSSTGFRSENTWHEIRDHSFIQNHSRSSDSQLLLFSSLTHLLQGSDQRTPDTRSETIPSSRITPDLQIHSFFSSVHSLIFYRVQIREHLTQDQRPFLHPESLQIFRFTASSLQFTHLLQGSDQRTPDTRSETIPWSRITPDLQIHSFFSSVHSLIFYRVQIREHLTQDQRPFLHPESLQIFRFTASSLQFTHLLQGSDQRTPDTRSETIPSSRITPDLQIHSFFSSVHSLIFYRVQIREHLTQDQRPFLHPESLQIFRFTASSLQFTHSSSTGFRSENTWHEIRDRSFIQNHSRSSDSQLLLFSSPHSSSTGFRSENTWHEIRDHSFIQNHSRSSDSQLLLFSSLTHLLQGSDQRTPDTRSETVPSSRITPDLQIHSFFSSVHSLIFYRVQIREHLTQDQRPFLHPESLQIFRFTASSLQFTHLLQGSDQRTPDTRSETIPSSRITPDLQIHSFFSSVHSLIFYRVQIREHLTQDQRPFLHPESLQIFRFTASSLQFTHSSSTGFRSENTWHEIRDRSFIQNHSRSSDSQLLLFSSLTHLLQGSGQRTPDTRSETIPSSRITPDLQIHSFSSSVHSLIFYRVQVREHLTQDQRPFLDPESLQIFRFTASSLQFTHSSSTGFRSENTWHKIRDHSFIQNHSRSSDSQLLLFSSLIFYRVQIREHLTQDQRPFLHPESLQIFRFTASSLQFTHSSSTGFRSENTWHKIRDHSFIQNHSRSSDSQLLLFSSLIFYRVQIRGLEWPSQKLGFVLSDTFLFCFFKDYFDYWLFKDHVWIIVRLEDPNMVH